MFEKDLPHLYPGEEKEVTLHMDPAPAHVHEKTYKWLNQRRIKYIPKEKWMANSLDMAPMDYCVNSNFKNIWSRKEAKNRVELATIAKRVWKDFPQGNIFRSLKSWPSRIDKMVENRGFQVENMM